MSQRGWISFSLLAEFTDSTNFAIERKLYFVKVALLNILLNNDNEGWEIGLNKGNYHQFIIPFHLYRSGNSGYHHKFAISGCTSPSRRTKWPHHDKSHRSPFRLPRTCTVHHHRKSGPASSTTRCRRNAPHASSTLFLKQTFPHCSVMFVPEYFTEISPSLFLLKNIFLRNNR